MTEVVENKDNQLFTEMTEDESSQVSGGCYRSWRRASYGYGYGYGYGYRPVAYYYAPSSYYGYRRCRRSYYY